MTSIGILQTGAVPLHLADRHGPYDGMMRRMLGDRYAYRTYDVAGRRTAGPAGRPCGLRHHGLPGRRL